ncbi:MAG: glycosyl hydrolase [Pirellulales bacterium]
MTFCRLGLYRPLSRPLSYAAATLMVLLAVAVQAASDSSGKDSTKLDPVSFANPPNEYRPVDCWWWEAGTLTEERLRWQLEQMHAQGVGGTWLYPRFGASQPLSSEPGFWTDGWWEFVRFVLDEHQRLGMVQFANDWLGRLDKAYFQSQLRNEAKQDSKLAGRRLVAHFARSTAAETLTLQVPDGEEILTAAAYHLREQREDAVEDETRVDLSDQIDGQQLKWEAPGPEWLVAAVCSQPHDLNYLERHVADRWIEIFYEKYREQLGNRLGKSLVAYGPDERSVLGGNILYCDGLRTRFEKEKGYDPLPDLAALFLDIGPRTDCVRCQYYDVMNTLLEENLYAPMADWLHGQNMKHVTIATWGRENLLEQTSNYGDFPRMMKHFDMPGNEDSRQSGSLGAFIDTKMSSSMAHLNGQPRVAVCVYWGMGWGFTQEENIARTNINYALGVNFYNTHGVLYSLLAGRNEWVPPEVHFYQPYWETWRTFADNFSRLSYALSQGRHRADVAIVYPLSTIHARWHNGSKFERPAEEAQNTTFALAKTLYANQLDFNFVDEARLAVASSESGRINVSDLEFPVVALPSMTTIRTDAMARLREFVAAGGTLVVVGEPPTASAEAGRDDPNLQAAWQELLGDYASAGDSVVEQSNAAGGRTILVRTVDSDVTKAIRAAIHPDVTTTATDLMHTHQQVGDQHVYYFVNRLPQSRTVNVTVSGQGKPEIWDPLTGEIHPLLRFRTVAKGTELRLDMDPHEGVLVVLQPDPVGPQVVADNLLVVQSVEQRGDDWVVVGTANTAEKLQAEIELDGRVFAGESAAPPAVTTLELDDSWECEYRPTMNNQWGDFRYPASAEMIGPEAPRMKYRAEPQSAEGRPHWEEQKLDDDDWQQVTCTFGPYWQVLEPLAARLDTDELRQSILAGGAKKAEAVESDGKSYRWQPYVYSWKYGADRIDVHQSGNDGIGPVPPHFLVFDAVRGGQPVVRYLTTRVYSPRHQTLYLDFGGREKLPSRQAWVNGELVIDIKDQPLPALSEVKLKSGWNQVVLRLVQASGRPVSTFAVFHSQPQTPEQPRFMPLSRWHDKQQELVYDYRSEGPESVGWYRFLAPPGARHAKLNLVAESVEAWVNGEAVEVVDDTLRFPTAADSKTHATQVALRVRHKPGSYEGAAFQAPVAFECGRGRIPLGDWSQFGLDYYSGGVKYFRRVPLGDELESHQVLLDLGDVRTSAEVKVNGRSLGVRLASPFVFDLSEAVQIGDNEIEVEVLNTLANYMSAGPSKYVYKGQTVSGVLGPVTLQLVPRVRIECHSVGDSGRRADGGAE